MSEAANSIEAALMGKTTYTLDMAQAGAAMRKIPIESIRDVRSLGIDLLLVLRSGGQILLQEGALDALVHPNRRLEFSDGVLTLQQIFMQSERFDFLNSSSDASFAVDPALLIGALHQQHRDSLTTLFFGA